MVVLNVGGVDVGAWQSHQQVRTQPEDGVDGTGRGHLPKRETPPAGKLRGQQTLDEVNMEVMSPMTIRCASALSFGGLRRLADLSETPASTKADVLS